MSEEKEKKLSVLILVTSIVVGLVILWSGYVDYQDSQVMDNLAQANINSIAPSEIIDGLCVEGTVRYAMDAFASYGDDNSDDYQYYMVAAAEFDEVVVGLKVFPKDYAAIEAQIEYMYNMPNDETAIPQFEDIPIYGVVRKMEGKVLDFYKEIIVESGWSDEAGLELALSEDFLPYYIEPIPSADSSDMVSTIVVGIGAMLFGIIQFLAVLRRHKVLDTLHTFDAGIGSGVAQGLKAFGSSTRQHSSLNGEMRDSEQPPMGFEE